MSSESDSEYWISIDLGTSVCLVNDDIYLQCTYIFVGTYLPRKMSEINIFILFVLVTMPKACNIVYKLCNWNTPLRIYYFSGNVSLGNLCTWAHFILPPTLGIKNISNIRKIVAAFEKKCIFFGKFVCKRFYQLPGRAVT